MCGIVGAISYRPVEKILLNGLKRLEYRGYDSAGIALLDEHQHIQRERQKGKIRDLEAALQSKHFTGQMGIAHTRWATHGAPSVKNAHPFTSHNQFAVVHNGIIENYLTLRKKLITAGYVFTSDTDSETIVHLLHFHYQKNKNILSALQKTMSELKGAYALGILSSEHPNQIFAMRGDSPLVIGKGIGENFLASDPLALLSVTREFIYLQEGDIAEIGLNHIEIYHKNKKISREVHHLTLHTDNQLLPPHKHYMAQEIFAQPEAVARCLENRDEKNKIQNAIFGNQAKQILENIKQITLIACGTSYHAALVARYWIEKIAKIPCSVEIASEYRYREAVLSQHSLAIFISQSGETADTLAALRLIKEKKITKTLAICNIAESALVREADFHFLTHAGTEIGVASTKAFTTQLVALLLFTLSLSPEKNITQQMNVLKKLPIFIEKILNLNETIKTIATDFTEKVHALFLGRDVLFPIALEGALKIKEISYIHAEGYPAGELKHGPLALVDQNMPVIALAPKNNLFAKMCSNLQEVHARNGKLYVLTDNKKTIHALDKNICVIEMPTADEILLPILYTIPLQLLSYHVAILKGTDVDQPRNLAKSVTVE